MIVRPLLIFALVIGLLVLSITQPTQMFAIFAIAAITRLCRFGAVLRQLSTRVCADLAAISTPYSHLSAVSYRKHCWLV